MKFEDALSLLRQGKKIRHKQMPEDEYLQACYMTIPLLEESFELAKSRGISIVYMKGERQHEYMEQRNFLNKEPCCNPELHSYPQLNLYWVISEEWEIIA